MKNKFLVNKKKKSDRFKLELHIGDDVRLWNCLEFNVRRRYDGTECIMRINHRYDEIEEYMLHHMGGNEFGSFIITDNDTDSVWVGSGIIDAMWDCAVDVSKIYFIVENFKCQ